MNKLLTTLDEIDRFLVEKSWRSMLLSVMLGALVAIVILLLP